MNDPISGIAFTAAVKAAREERGSRASYARMEQRGDPGPWGDVVTPYHAFSLLKPAEIIRSPISFARKRGTTLAPRGSSLCHGFWLLKHAEINR